MSRQVDLNVRSTGQLETIVIQVAGVVVESVDVTNEAVAGETILIEQGTNPNRRCGRFGTTIGKSDVEAIGPFGDRIGKGQRDTIGRRIVNSGLGQQRLVVVPGQCRPGVDQSEKLRIFRIVKIQKLIIKVDDDLVIGLG